MTKPFDRVSERLLGIGDEECARIDSERADPQRRAEAVEWLDDPDPFGMDWTWAEPEPESESSTSASAGRLAAARGDRSRGGLGDPALPFEDQGRPRTGRTASRRAFRIAGWAAAASLLIAAGLIGRAWRIPRERTLREEGIAVWTADVSSARIAADDRSEKSAAETMAIDHTLEANKAITPSVLAPVAVQESLEVPEVPEPASLEAGGGKPVATVVTRVATGGMFYFLFKTPGWESDGTAVAIRMGPGGWKLLWEEAAVSSNALVNVLGPVKARGPSEDYLIISADRTATPLLKTVASCLPEAGPTPVQPESWRPRMADALRRAGHSWFALQRVRVEAGPNPSTRP